jgi:hypothetical protein
MVQRDLTTAKQPATHEDVRLLAEKTMTHFHSNKDCGKLEWLTCVGRSHVVEHLIC